MKKTAIALAIALGAMSSTASALTINQLMSSFPLFQLEDDSFEAQGVDANGNGELDVGDTLRGIISFPQFRDLSTNTDYALDGTANSTLAAIFEAKVTSVSPGTAAGNRLFTFGPSTNLSSFGNGAMVVFYEGGGFASNTTCNTGAGNTCEQAITSTGTQVMVLGIPTIGNAGYDIDNFWGPALGPLKPASGRDFTTTNTLGQFSFGLGVISSSLGQFYDNVALNPGDAGLGIPADPTYGDSLGNDAVQYTGSGSIYGTKNSSGIQTTNYQATDDAQLIANRIPEPATLGLLGLGLLGMASLRRRKSA